MTDEDAFLRKLADTPADDTARLVYADWLDEHGDEEALRKAEFLRLQHHLRADKPGWLARRRARRRLVKLAEALPSEWLAVVGHATVENCPTNTVRRRVVGELFSLRFAYECPKDWAALDPTEAHGVRFCRECQKPVTFCETIDAARDIAERGGCIAVNLAVPRWPGDLELPRMMKKGVMGLD